MVELDWAVLLGLTAIFLYVGVKHARWREK
jgi:ABC-type multidrug transport system permease subunit